MPAINLSHDRAVRRRYRLAAIVFLAFSVIVIWLLRMPGMTAAVPKPFAADWRMPLAVAGVFVATGLVWTAHRKMTWLVSLFPLYRLVVLLLNGLAKRHLELRPDPGIFDPGEPTALAQVGQYLLQEYKTATPGYELSTFGAGQVSLPLVGALGTSVVALIAAGLLVVVVLLLWWAAAARLTGR